jgi:hypothetical protein
VGELGEAAGCSTTAGGAGCDVVGAALAGTAAGTLAAFVLSAPCVVDRRDDGKNLGVTTMTSAIKIIAIMVRLSMQVREVAKEPDRSRRVGMDDSGQFVALPAMYPGALRVARALQWRMLSSLDNNGTRMEAAAREPPDTREPSIRGLCASELQTRLVAGEVRPYRHDVIT